MNLSIFLSVIILIFVQSHSCESSRNVTKRGNEVKWKPYHCSLDKDETYGPSLLYLVLDLDFLYFFFTEYVVRIKQIEISYNYLCRVAELDKENFFEIYDEPEYARYNDMPSKPDILGRNIHVFFYYKSNEKTKSYVVDEGPDTTKKNDKAYRIIFDSSAAG